MFLVALTKHIFENAMIFLFFNPAVEVPVAVPAELKPPASSGFGSVSGAAVGVQSGKKPPAEVTVKKKDGKLNCDCCLVRNEASAAQCVSCQTPCTILEW